jgi:hypothetical protein
MIKLAGSGFASGSISQRHESPDPDPDPDPHQNGMDSQHWFKSEQQHKYNTNKTKKYISNPSGSAVVIAAVAVVNIHVPVMGSVSIDV